MNTRDRSMRAPRVTHALVLAGGLAALFGAGCGGGDGDTPMPPQVLGVSMAPSAFTIPWIGASLQVAVTATTTTGDQDITTAPTTGYSSGNTSVAGVTSTGEVVANGAGATNVVVTSAGLSDTSAVTVDTLAAIAASSVALTAPTSTLTAASPSVQTRTEIVWSNGARLRNAQGRLVTYASDDTTVARVDESGLVTAVGDGDARITASFGGTSGQLTILVALSPPVSFQNDVLPLFTSGVSRCTDAACHPGTGTPQRNLRMNTYANVVSGASTNGPIVIPGDGAASLLVRVLRGSVGEIGSTRMPKGRTALSASAIDKVERWIDEGANNN